MKRRLHLAVGCLACATSAVSSAASCAAPVAAEYQVQRVAAYGSGITNTTLPGSPAEPITGCPTAPGWTFTNQTNHPKHPSMKTYLIYPKTGRPLRVEAETIGFVRDGVVVLHNAQGQPIAVIPVTETAGVIEEGAVTAAPVEATPAKAKAKGTVKSED